MGLPQEVLSAGYNLALRTGIDEPDAISYAAEAWSDFPDHSLWYKVAFNKCVDQRRAESGRNGPDHRALSVLDEPLSTDDDDTTRGDLICVCDDPGFAQIETIGEVVSIIADLPDEDLAALFRHFWLNLPEGHHTPKAVIFAKAMRHARVSATCRAEVPQKPKFKKSESVLTKREIEVLEFAAQGHGSKQTASALGLRPDTIKNHLWRIGHKLNACNTTHAVALAMQAGWLFNKKEA